MMMIQVERGATDVVTGAFANSPSTGGNARLWLLASLLCSAASPALSQGTAASAAAPTAVADSAPTAADTTAPVAAVDPNALQEIVVTATKRETNLQKTPIAINVATAQALTDRHAQSLIDLGDGTIPSLRVATFEARNSALTIGIRGIVPFDANQTARDQGVGVYIDGIYLGRQQGLNASLLDIERIEVLKGPQGTLFGRNTEGGALSIVTKAPTGEFGLRGKVGVGNFGSRNAELHIDLPVFDTLSVKFDGIYQHQDATVKNPLAGQTGWNYHDVVGGRVAARWKPTDNLTIDVAYDRTHDENTPNYSQLINYNPLGKTIGQYDSVTNKLVAPGSPAGTSTVCTTCIAPLSPLVVVSGGNRQDTAEIGVPQQPSIDNTQGVSGIIRYKVTPTFELRSITGWREVETRQWDNSGGAHRTIFAPNANFSRYSLSELFQHQWSQEFQAVGTLPSLDYVLGAYYFTEKVSEAAATPTTNRWNVDGTGFTINSETRPNPSAPVTSSNQGWDRRDWFVQRDSHAKATSYAFFGQAVWSPSFLDGFHLTAGARYTHDKRDGVLTTVQGRPTNFVFKYTKSRIDPLIIAAYDVTPTVNVYAKYSTGFRAGGANSRSQTFRAFGPETVKAYEIGAKSDLFDHHVRLNLAAYLMDRTGTQTDFDNVDTDPTSPTFNLHTEETINAPGKSKIKGFEADLTVKPINNLEFGVSYAYTSVKIPATANPFLPGNPLFQVFTVFTPKHAASGYIDYSVPTRIANADLRFHLDAAYASRQYSFQAEPVKTDPSFVVNGSIALANVEVASGTTLMTFSVWSRNLLNETHIYRRSAANAGVLGDYGNFNPPRTFGVEAAFKLRAPRHTEPYIAPPPPPPEPAAPAPATQTCSDGSVILASDACPPPPPPPPPPPAPERGGR